MTKRNPGIKEKAHKKATTILGKKLENRKNKASMIKAPFMPKSGNIF